MKYPVITLQQPWATWIMREWKTIETRTHQKFKGLVGQTILIHAGKSTDQKAIYCPYLTIEQLRQNPGEVINGFILGSAFVYGFMELREEHSQAALIDCKNVKRYGLFLKDIKPFKEPINVLGELGVWYFDIEGNRKTCRPMSPRPLFD